jgi:hypothetical protein
MEMVVGGATLRPAGWREIVDAACRRPESGEDGSCLSADTLAVVKPGFAHILEVALQAAPAVGLLL